MNKRIEIYLDRLWLLNSFVNKSFHALFGMVYNSVLYLEWWTWSVYKCFIWNGGHGVYPDINRIQINYTINSIELYISPNFIGK